MIPYRVSPGRGSELIDWLTVFLPFNDGVIIFPLCLLLVVQDD